MKKTRYSKLIIAIVYVLFSLTLLLYFAIVGLVGVFVISHYTMEKYAQGFADINDDMIFIINFSIGSLLGMIPCGVVVITCIKTWMIRWKVPTIEDGLKQLRNRD